MKIIASLAISSDGHTDDNNNERLVLSNTEDWQKVYKLRSEVDAILIGGETLRRDNPSLLIKDDELRNARINKGLNADIAKIVISKSLNLDPKAKFFTRGECEKIIICDKSSSSEDRKKFEDIATIICLENLDAKSITDALSFNKLMIEGGATTLKPFFDADLIDEFRLAISTKKVDDNCAPKFNEYQEFIDDKAQYLKLHFQQRLGDMTVCHFIKKDNYFMEMAIGESSKAIPTSTNFRVGAVVVANDGQFCWGFTGENDPKNHAEEEAISKAEELGISMLGATIYSSLEPCSKRNSKSKSCTELILENGFKKVVYALSEPIHFQDCKGEETLKANGVEVVILNEYASDVEQINSHII